MGDERARLSGRELWLWLWLSAAGRLLLGLAPVLAVRAASRYWDPGDATAAAPGWSEAFEAGATSESEESSSRASLARCLAGLWGELDCSEDRCPSVGAGVLLRLAGGRCAELGVAERSLEASRVGLLDCRVTSSSVSEVLDFFVPVGVEACNSNTAIEAAASS